jgi:CRP-like cAMP-binding protein
MIQPTYPSPGNRLLARLPQEDYQRLLPHLRSVSLEFKAVLHEARSPIDYIYFPVTGVTSTLTIMQDGNAIEVATVGNEGVAGLPALFGPAASPNRVIVQVAGEGLRIEAGALQEEARTEGPVRRLLSLYQAAFLAQVSQSVACNGLHCVRQRCCRWLLMTHDRIRTDQLPLTHEFLAMMLGVRRPGVTEVLQTLQDQGLLHLDRGRITIQNRKKLEAVSCECYRTVKDEYERLFA